MTPKQEMLAYPHRDGLVSYLTHGFKGWDSPGPVDDETVEVRACACACMGCAPLGRREGGIGLAFGRLVGRRFLPRAATQEVHQEVKNAMV